MSISSSHYNVIGIINSHIMCKTVPIIGRVKSLPNNTTVRIKFSCLKYRIPSKSGIVFQIDISKLIRFRSDDLHIMRYSKRQIICPQLRSILIIFYQSQSNRTNLARLTYSLRQPRKYWWTNQFRIVCDKLRP